MRHRAPEQSLQGFQMKKLETIDVNRPSTIWAMTLLAALTPAPTVLGPLIVGLYVTNLGLNAEQAGYLIAAELIGAALSTFSTLALFRRVNWHRILYTSTAVIIVADIISCLFTAFHTLLLIRFLSGVALGTIMTMTIVVSGMMRDQERAFGFWSLGQIIFAVSGFAIFPHVFPIIGVRGFFLVMASFMALLLFPIRFMPVAGPARHAPPLTASPPRSKRLFPLGLLALLLFYTAIGGVWAYVERIANQAGFRADAIGYVLSSASIVGVAGAGGATWLSKRFGRLLPAVCGYVLIGAGIAFFFNLQSMLFYIIGSFAFKLSWWFTSPYLLANMTTLDPSGRVAVFVNFVVACGMGSGPAVAATVLEYSQYISNRLDYNYVLVFGIICLTLSFPLLYMVIRENSKVAQLSVTSQTS